jgi:hypothetical protein
MGHHLGQPTAFQGFRHRLRVRLPSRLARYLAGAGCGVACGVALGAEKFTLGAWRDSSVAAKYASFGLKPAVVTFALDRDAVFGSRQLILQAQEVFIRFQLRIVLHDHKQAANCTVQLLIGGDLVRRRASREQPGTGCCDIAEHLLFLPRDALYGFNQVGNQVGAALQHNIDLRPRGLDRFILSHEIVADAYVLSERDQRDQYQDNKHNQTCFHVLLL